MKTKFLSLILLSMIVISCGKDTETGGEPKPNATNVELTLINFESTLASLYESDLSEIQFRVLHNGVVVESIPEKITIENSDVHFLLPNIAGGYQLQSVESKTTKRSASLGITIDNPEQMPRVKATWNPTFTGIGVGTTEEPFLVTNIDQFKTIAQNPTLNYQLANDLDFAAEDNWKPIPKFSGVLDGGFNQLVNFRSYFPMQEVVSGLIQTNSGTIKNLTIRGRNTEQPDLGSIWSGAFATTNRGTIINCSNYCKMGNSLYQGGIVSCNEGIIKNCSNYGSASDATSYGGIASFCDEGGAIENCYNRGSVILRDNDLVIGFSGGIISYDYMGEGAINMIKNCYNSGTIEPGNDIVGPIYGRNLNTTVTSCFFLIGATPSAADDPNVLGKTDAELKKADTFTGWAFGNSDDAPWKMSKNGYPILYWERE